jgi:hypothetical protein
LRLAHRPLWTPYADLDYEPILDVSLADSNLQAFLVSPGGNIHLAVHRELLDRGLVERRAYQTA